ncbi:hypothetical protein BIW11_04591 [Tropilaelaps mercedesae]|uniref:Uncharacterized protein n=1 Tax=Tropilaelaps mercedesae TaxID=418985 RepID=A0A1V9X3R3_9ACAR|nr:hypothetical protein BIW11_04591 [Tropilaelaps mercedesae]
MAPTYMKNIRSTVAGWFGKKAEKNSTKCLILDDRIISVKVKSSKKGDFIILKRMKLQGVLHTPKTYTTKVEARKLEELQLTQPSHHLGHILMSLTAVSRLDLTDQNITMNLAKLINKIQLKILTFTACHFDVQSLHIIMGKMSHLHAERLEMHNRCSGSPSPLDEASKISDFEVQSFPGSRTRIHFSRYNNNAICFQLRDCTVSTLLCCIKYLSSEPRIGLQQVATELRELATSENASLDSVDQDEDSGGDPMGDSGLERSFCSSCRKNGDTRSALRVKESCLKRTGLFDSGVDFNHRCESSASTS